jgi:trigger factor
VFIEGEVSQMVATFEERVTRAGMTMEDYLKQIDKSYEDIRKEWRPDAEKRAKLQIIFNEIAHKENIVPNQEKLEREVSHIKEHYPEAQEHAIRVYVAAQMTNDLAFRFLEGRLDEKEEEHEDPHHGHTHA